MAGRSAVRRRAQAAIKKGVKRFVLVTSIGTGDSRGAPPQQVYDVLEKVLVQKGKAEEFLQVLLLPSEACTYLPDPRPPRLITRCRFFPRLGARRFMHLHAMAPSCDVSKAESVGF